MGRGSPLGKRACERINEKFKTRDIGGDLHSSSCAAHSTIIISIIYQGI